MNIPFSKYHGTGNDFVVIDNRAINWLPSRQQVLLLCDRHFGIGGDGLMLLTEKTGYDFAMTYYNSDGNESTMCGNGGRCMTAFAKKLGLAGKEAFFWAIDGSHEARVAEGGPSDVFHLKMKDTVIGQTYPDGIFLDTGSPHFVTFVNDAANTDVFQKGSTLRNDRRFAPGGTNVDFVEIQSNGLFVRTYERGVENETLSCGTGVTASAIAVASAGNEKTGTYDVATPGGALKVRFVQTGNLFSEIWLEGPAEFVFEGEVKI